MKTIYNHAANDLMVHVGDRKVLIAAHGTKELEDAIADLAVAQARKDGVPFDFNPERTQGIASTTDSAPGPKSRFLAHLMELAKEGPLMPIGTLDEKNLLALEKPVLLKIAGFANCPPLLDDAAKQTIVDEILEAVTAPTPTDHGSTAAPTFSTAESSSGRTPGQTPGKVGSTPATATNSERPPTHVGATVTPKPTPFSPAPPPVKRA